MCYRCRASQICDRIDAVLADEKFREIAPNIADLLTSARDCIATYRNAEIVQNEVLNGNAKIEIEAMPQVSPHGPN